MTQSSMPSTAMLCICERLWSGPRSWAGWAGWPLRCKMKDGHVSAIVSQTCCENTYDPLPPDFLASWWLSLRCRQQQCFASVKGCEVAHTCNRCQQNLETWPIFDPALWYADKLSKMTCKVVGYLFNFIIVVALGQCCAELHGIGLGQFC